MSIFFIIIIFKFGRGFYGPLWIQHVQLRSYTDKIRIVTDVTCPFVLM